MPVFGNIIVIKRNGTDGINFPLTARSCLFGRTRDCDIRMQLPQVSKEHCKIEINENKEAVLTNLSAVNPTKLNGACLQKPVALRHGDVLTIIDRSFRFECPLQATPKRLSRSAKDETLQVLHVQQVADVELLHNQSPGSKSLHASDNAEEEEKKTNENKQNTEKTFSRVLPTQLQTPKSSHRLRQAVKNQTELSPFSKLYEKLKHEMEVKKPLQQGQASQAAAREGGRNVLLCPSALMSTSSCVYDLGSLTKETEAGRRENAEGCKIQVKQDVITLEFNRFSVVGGAARKSFTRSPQTSFSMGMWRDGGRSTHLEEPKELSTPGKSPEAPSQSRKEGDGSVALPREVCPIVRSGYSAGRRSPPRSTDKSTQTNQAADVSEAAVVATPPSRRKSPRSASLAAAEESSRMSLATADTPTGRRRAALKRKALSEVLAETPREGLQQLPLAEKKGLMQTSQQATPGKPVKEAALKEICDQAKLVHSEEGQSGERSSSQSLRRSSRQSKEFSNPSDPSEMCPSEVLPLLSPPAQKPGSAKKRSRPRTSGVLAEKALEVGAQETHEKTADRSESGTEEELPTKGCHQNQALEDGIVTRPCRLSAGRKSSGNAAALEGSEAPFSEMNISGLLAAEESGKQKRILQKKSDDSLLQPLGKRKRVSFGGQLSPELFDKTLPPNSPLKKGATPARLSLPLGHSPRAVLKKAQGLKHFAVQEFSEHLQKEKMSPKHLEAQKSPAASSPASPKATPKKFTSASPAPSRRGRFSISHVMTLPIAEEEAAGAEEEAAGAEEEAAGAEEEAAGAEEEDTKQESDAQEQTPTSSHVKQDQSSVTAPSAQLRRSSHHALKTTPMKRRSGAVAVLKAKRRSGASSANLLVAKSWAEVVRLSVARSQSKTVKRSVQKGRPQKKPTQSPKTPERKTQGHLSTGHAKSPATIVVGRAHSTTVRTPGQVPKLVPNPLLKLNMNMDESFTGVTEMFQTPEKSGETFPLATLQKADLTPTCSAEELSELHTPEEIGEMMVSPLNSSGASEQKHDSPGICCILREGSLHSVFDAISSETPEGRKALLEENIIVDALSSSPENQESQVKSGSKRRTLRKKSEPVEVMSGIKELFRTPKRRSEPAEALSGIKQLVKTPKQKPEPVEALSGIKQLMKTPKQKPEPVEALSGIKQLMKTPKQKPEPVEALSGIKQLMKTPKQKPEPVEALSGIKQLMRTPKQKTEPVEVLSGTKQLVKTPKQKPEPVEALSGIKQLMKTPKQRPEAVEALSGIKQLMKTPRQKPEPVEALSGIKQLMKTPKQKPEPVEALSGIKQLMRTPKQKTEPVEALSGIKQLMRTPKQKTEPVEVLSGIKQLMRTPKQKPEPVEVLSGTKQLVKTPKQKPEPVEVLSGIKQLLKTPKQRPEAVEALSGIKELMRTPKQKPEPVEVLSGIKQLMKTPQQELEPVTDEIALRKLLKTPVQKRGEVKDGAGVNSSRKTPRLKYQAVEDMVGVSRIFRTPREKAEPVTSMFGISRLMKTPREKPEALDDFVGLQSLLAEPRQKRCSVEVDYAGVTELFATPEGRKVRSANVLDSKDPAPPCPHSSPSTEVKEKISQVEDSQQQASTSEEQSTQRPRRGRACKKEHPASAKQCEEELNPKELQGLEKKSIQEEMGELTTSASVAKSRGRGKRTNSCTQEEIVSRQPAQEKDETVSFVEPLKATQRPGRDRRIKPKELKDPSEHLDSCGKDSSVPGEELGGLKQTLQESGIVDITETQGEPPIKKGRVSSSTQDENGQLQTGLDKPDDKSNEEMLLSPGRRTRRVQKVEKTEPLIPTRRGRRAINNQVKQPSSEDLQGTAEQLPKDPEAKVIQRGEETFDKAAETAPAEESGSGTKGEVKRTEKTVRSLRSARKHSAEVRAELCDGALENAQTIQKAEETSTETQPHMKNEIKIPRGDEAETTQENSTGASQRLKAESPSGETKAMPVTALNLEPNRRRSRRGKKDSLETKTDGFAKDANNVELMTPQIKSETDASCLTDSLGSDCVKVTAQSSPAANSDGLARGHQRRMRNEQGKIKAKPAEILPENPAQTNGMACRRGRKVKFELEEASSKAAEGKRSLPEDDKETTSKEGQQKASETLQVRRSRRKQEDSIPETACPASLENQPGIADQSENEASVQEQVAALEAAPSSPADSVPRRGRKREVAAASQPSRSLSVRTRRGLLGAAAKTTEREDEKSSLGTMQARGNASAREKGQELHPAAEEKSSSSLQRKCGLEMGDKEEGTSEEQNTPLETAKEKPVGKGRRKEAAQASLPTISLRGKRGLAANNGGEAAPKEDQNVPSETSDSSAKANLRRRGGKEIALVLEVTSSTQGRGGLSKGRGRKNNCREEKKQVLENPTSQEKMDLSKENLKQEITSQAVASPSLQGLSEAGRIETPPEEQQSLLLDAALAAKENLSRVGRKKGVSSKSEETSSALLREKPDLPKGRGQKRILKESDEMNSSQERTMQLRKKRKKGEFPAEAATSASPPEKSSLPENSSTSETQSVSWSVPPGEGKEGTPPVQQAAPTSRRRKCQLPAADFTAKKLKAESKEKGSLGRGKRNKTKEELGEEVPRAAQAAGGMDRKTRSSARTRK